MACSASVVVLWLAQPESSVQFENYTGDLDGRGRHAMSAGDLSRDGNGKRRFSTSRLSHVGINQSWCWEVSKKVSEFSLRNDEEDCLSRSKLPLVFHHTPIRNSYLRSKRKKSAPISFPQLLSLASMCGD